MTYERDGDDVELEREATGWGTILGIILALFVVLAIIWFFFLGGLGGAENRNTASGRNTTVQTETSSDTNTNTKR